jgi:hypothetical protein
VAFPKFDPAKHPRDERGRFGILGIDRKKYPNAFSRGTRGDRVEFKVRRGRGKKTVRGRLSEFGPISVAEGPWFYKKGVRETPSRLGGRKATTTLNVTAGRRTQSGAIEVVTLPRLKQAWRVKKKSARQLMSGK